MHANKETMLDGLIHDANSILHLCKFFNNVLVIKIWRVFSKYFLLSHGKIIFYFVFIKIWQEKIEQMSCK